MSVVFSSPILKELNERGFLYQFTDAEAIDKLFCSREAVVFYIGFDATAKSLHVGQLIWIKLVNKLQKAGAKPIIIAGGATSKIGDPTWKDTQRVMLDDKDIHDNINSIMSTLSKLIKFGDDGNSAKLLNNDEWISKINYMEFLRDYGPLFSINKMLAMDSVKSRLEREQHLSFLEFNYMLLQAYDFLYLYEKYDCVLELGGADQWSNMISGIDLIRRKAGKQVFGISNILLTNSDGKKMGKTEKGTVWLDENLTSPFDFWQYWRNVDDKDVVKLLKLFTDIEISEIEKFEHLVGTKEINEAKILLADEVTKFIHPNSDIKSIKSTANSLFKGSDEALDNLEEFCLPNGIAIDRALVETGLAKSQTLAKRLIEGNGVKVNGNIVESPKYQVEENCIISVGKKSFVKVKVL